MPDAILVRPIARGDYVSWRPLWDGYNRFYGRHESTALPDNITATTWERFFSPEEPVRALVAEARGLVGIAHYVSSRYHSAFAISGTCHSRRTAPSRHWTTTYSWGLCSARSSSRVYWQTRASNAPGRALYDKVATHHGFIVYSHEL